MPDPTLQGTALRYAAGDLPPPEAVAFEARLAEDQDARDALAEAVRLSAAALGQSPPVPHPVVRHVVRARVTRRAALPLAWAMTGAIACVAVVLAALVFADRAGPSDAMQSVPPPVAPESPELLPPEPPPLSDDTVLSSRNDAEDDHTDPRSVAEIWADLSTPETVEKARDEELRWRQKVREMGPGPYSAGRPGTPGGESVGN